VLIFLVVALVGYLAGSFPTGYLAGRLAGVDIRKIGSGNIGATNVTRALGKPFGYSVFVVDLAKGFVAVMLAKFIAQGNELSAGMVDFYGAVAGVCSVLGHSYPIWLGFKGGKGVATSIGALFGLNWIAALIVCVVWVIIFQTLRYVSVASIAAALAFPITIGAMLALNQLKTPVLLYFSLILAAVVIVRHRSNLSRLLNGTEPRYSRK
jgi:glycerol-3-phosphate acyltransferase PlsY